MVITKATATATTTCGVTITPSTPISTTASSVDVNGSRSMAAAHRPNAHADPCGQVHAGQPTCGNTDRCADEH